VSGAGDTVIATFAKMLGAGLPLVEAVVIANRAAGIVVGKLCTATVEYDELFLRTTAARAARAPNAYSQRQNDHDPH
ncbi:PfkB family carbohydrate kinase, partial [Burkholderia pseudomallei]